MSRAAVPARERLIFAMDVPTPDAARRLADQLGDSVSFYKLGLELFMSGGAFELLDTLVGRGKKIFLDLKLFDVPATVAGAVRNLRNRGITFATVHGNQAIMEAAAQAADGVGILAVTVLTSLDRGDLDDLGFDCDVEELVLSRARRALADADFQWAAELTDYVLTVDEGHVEAKRLKAAALSELGERQISAIARNYYLSAAQYLLRDVPRR